MKKIPEHVAIVADAGAGSSSDVESLFAERLHTSRAALGFAESSDVRFLTLCIETKDRTLDGEAAARLAYALRAEIEAVERRGLEVQITQRSGRADLVRATRRLAEQVRNGSLRPDDVTLELLQKNLSSAALPDPDLIILCGRRSHLVSSPEADIAQPQSLSGCLLYECAYAELHFCASYYTEFSLADWHRALHDYSLRDRRFGRAPELVSSLQARIAAPSDRPAANP